MAAVSTRRIWSGVKRCVDLPGLATDDEKRTDRTLRCVAAAHFQDENVLHPRRSTELAEERGKNRPDVLPGGELRTSTSTSPSGLFRQITSLFHVCDAPPRRDFKLRDAAADEVAAPLIAESAATAPGKRQEASLDALLVPSFNADQLYAENLSQTLGTLLGHPGPSAERRSAMVPLVPCRMIHGDKTDAQSKGHALVTACQVDQNCRPSLVSAANATRGNSPAGLLARIIAQFHREPDAEMSHLPDLYAPRTSGDALGTHSQPLFNAGALYAGNLTQSLGTLLPFAPSMSHSMALTSAQQTQPSAARRKRARSALEWVRAVKLAREADDVKRLERELISATGLTNYAQDQDRPSGSSPGTVLRARRVRVMLHWNLLKAYVRLGSYEDARRAFDRFKLHAVVITAAPPPAGDKLAEEERKVSNRLASDGWYTYVQFLFAQSADRNRREISALLNEASELGLEPRKEGQLVCFPPRQ